MANFIFQGAPLPTNFKGTPQELYEAILDRLEVVSDSTAAFVISDTAPTGNEGPWLKNGTQWWVWSESEMQYVPLDVSASVTQPFIVSDEEPDPEDGYQIWFETNEDADELLAIKVWLGEESGWVEMPDELGPNTITTVMLQDAVVTSDKLAPGSVVASKIQNDLPISKLERGAANQVMRMRSDASTADWRDWSKVTGEQSFSTAANELLEWEHGLDVVPSYIRGVLVCKTAEHGWEVGTELDCSAGAQGEGNPDSAFAVTDEKIFWLKKARPRFSPNPTGDPVALTAANWRIKVYYSV